MVAELVLFKHFPCPVTLPVPVSDAVFLQVHVYHVRQCSVYRSCLAIAERVK